MDKRSIYIVILNVGGRKHFLHSMSSILNENEECKSVVQIVLNGAVFLPVADDISTAKFFKSKEDAETCISQITNSPHVMYYLFSRGRPIAAEVFDRTIYVVDLVSSEVF